MKVILIILDGWGIAPRGLGNAITSANTPVIDQIASSYPSIALQASGIAVGLPWGEEGNSEVGHLNIGSGRAVPQYLPRIISAIRDGSFFQNETFKKAALHVKENNSALHLMGLVSSGSVHSYIDHLYALLDFAKKESISNVYLHIFTDGKDSPPQEAAKFTAQLKQRLDSQKLGNISTIIGRTYAMDRNENWGSTQKTYELLTQGKGEVIDDPVAYLEKSYTAGINDQYIEPAILNSKFSGFARSREARKIQNSKLIRDGDAVVFFNFREDSARQLTRAFIEEGFDKFPRKKVVNLFFAAMTRYLEDIPLSAAFPPPDVSNTLTQVLSAHGKKQLHIAETEKYAHVTYFFSGLVERPYEGEERALVTSMGTSHYDEYPEMQAQKITDKAIEGIAKFDFILINFANADMLGHTGNIQAAISGIETIDKSISRILASRDENTVVIITADHGNAEEMLNPQTGAKKTEHTSNAVPLFIVHSSLSGNFSKAPLNNQKPQGILADIAPTILEILQLPRPNEMTGQSLLKLF